MASPKSEILTALRTAENSVSGEVLSARLGISRVSVWKHVRKLQEAGYGIASSSRGYILETSPDALWPWEFPGREETVHHFESLDSTMEKAREMARRGCPAFTVVTAGRQTRGRGRLQRRWLSADGGLYFTLVTRPAVPPQWGHRVNFAAALTLALTLRELFQVEAAVKWPNDILVGERKLAGMLSEMEADSDRVRHVNVGLGLNVNNDPSAEEPRAVSLAGLVGKPVRRRDILARFLDLLEPRLTPDALEEAIESWKAFTVTIGRTVRVVTHREEIAGVARDVDADGALIVEQEDGTLQRVVYGDCFHR